MHDLDTEPRPSTRLWVGAAIGALALHLGGGGRGFNNFFPFLFGGGR